MDKLDHQHFIPKSYLKNFAQRKKDKKFVEILNLKTKETRLVSTRSICVKSGLYTLPKKITNDPYHLENFYAKNVDEAYQEVYDLLTNEGVTEISKRQKHKIIYTLLSLYFRTPKFLNGLNKLTDESLDKALMLADPNNDKISIDFLGQKLNFFKHQTDDIKKELHEQNREEFLTTHLEQWQKFVTYKYHCAISVFRIEGDVELITSDNPVVIHSATGNRFHLYDPTNIIEIPLDRRRFLFIYPNTEGKSPPKIYRSIRDKFFGLSLNFQVQKKAEQWIIGFPSSCVKHLADQEKYGENNEENLKMVESFQQRAKLMIELLSVMKRHGYFSIEAAEKVKQMKTLDCFKNDHDLEELIQELQQHGFTIN